MVLYGGATFREGDICVDYVMPQTKDPAVVGMLFWAANYGNAFLFMVNTVGEAKIVRRQVAKDKVDTSTLTDWTAAPAVKKNPGATNQLRVVLKGNSASTFINERPDSPFTKHLPKVWDLPNGAVYNPNNAFTIFCILF